MKGNFLSKCLILISKGDPEKFEYSINWIKRENLEGFDVFGICNINEEIYEIVRNEECFDEVFFGVGKTLEEHKRFVEEFKKVYDKVVVVWAGDKVKIGDEDDILFGSSEEWSEDSVFSIEEE